MRWRIVFACAAAATSFVAAHYHHRTAAARMPKVLSQAEQSAAQYLREALSAEAEGDLERRAAYLSDALNAAPDYAPVHWQLGEVRVGDEWLPIRAASRAMNNEEKLSRYRAARDVAGETATEQIRLARWCAHQGLVHQEQLHLAKALEREPTNGQTREIKSRLGLVRYDGRLVPMAEAEALDKETRQAAAAAESWKVRVSRWRDDLESKSQVRRAAGEEKLSAVRDPMAVATIERVFLESESPAALVAVKSLTAIENTRATDALARQSLFSRSEPVRMAAATALRDRDVFRYAPTLLANLKSPIEIRYETNSDATGGLRQRLSLFQEGPLFNTLRVFNHIERPQSAADAGLGNSRDPRRTVESVQHDRSQFFTSAKEDERLIAEAEAENAQIEKANERVFVALRLATNNPSIPDEPKQWWDWWDEYNETHRPQDKPTYESLRYVTSQAFRSHSCFVPGTKVWTSTGTAAIETISAGDFVLAQNVDTGELSYKAVSATTFGPPLPLMEIRAGGEQIRCTLGHLFWVSGTGWQMAKELQPGQLLYTALGPLAIDAVERSGEARCHNLIVPDFNTYFVSDAQVLVHDINIRVPTAARVPGLTEQ
jgi:hypothetical protein